MEHKTDFTGEFHQMGSDATHMETLNYKGNWYVASVYEDGVIHNLVRKFDSEDEANAWRIEFY